MGSIAIAGKFGLTKVFSAVVSPGTDISFTVPVKAFRIKPVGGDISFKFNSTDADADAFPIADGESLAFDLAIRFPVSSNVATLGTIFTSSGTVNVYVAVAF